MILLASEEVAGPRKMVSSTVLDASSSIRVHASRAQAPRRMGETMEETKKLALRDGGADGAFLIIEDDVAVGRAVARELQPFGPTRLLHNAESAYAALARQVAWAGAVFDVELGRECGLELLAFARRRHPDLAALVLTAHVEPQVNARACALGATYLCKPVDATAVVSWARRARAAFEGHDARVGATLDSVARACGWNAREWTVASLVLQGVGRGTLPSALGCKEDRAREIIRGVLRKANCGRLDELGIRLYSAAHHGGNPRRPPWKPVDSARRNVSAGGAPSKRSAR